MRMPRAQQSSPTKCCSRPCTLHDLALLNLLSGLLSVPGRGPATSAQVHTEDVDRQKKGAHVEGAAVFAAGDDVIEAAWSWHDFSTYVMISAEGCSLAVQLGKGNEIIMPIWCAATNAAVAYRCGPYPRAHYNSPRRATLRMLRPAAMPEQCGRCLADWPCHAVLHASFAAPPTSPAAGRTRRPCYILPDSSRFLHMHSVTRIAFKVLHLLLNPVTSGSKPNIPVALAAPAPHPHPVPELHANEGSWRASQRFTQAW